MKLRKERQIMTIRDCEEGNGEMLAEGYESAVRR
jgi:hypothetical protein